MISSTKIRQKEKVMGETGGPTEERGQVSPQDEGTRRPQDDNYAPVIKAM